jgi:hypothetical protein
MQQHESDRLPGQVLGKPDGVNPVSALVSFVEWNARIAGLRVRLDHKLDGSRDRQDGGDDQGNSTGQDASDIGHVQFRCSSNSVRNFGTAFPDTPVHADSVRAHEVTSQGG